jgi:hypothetical protein
VEKASVEVPLERVVDKASVEVPLARNAEEASVEVPVKVVSESDGGTRATAELGLTGPCSAAAKRVDPGEPAKTGNANLVVPNSGAAPKSLRLAQDAEPRKQDIAKSDSVDAPVSKNAKVSDKAAPILVPKRTPESASSSTPLNVAESPSPPRRKNWSPEDKESSLLRVEPSLHRVESFPQTGNSLASKIADPIASAPPIDTHSNYFFKEESDKPKTSEKISVEEVKTSKESELLSTPLDKISKESVKALRESEKISKESAKISRESEKISKQSEKISEESEKISKESEKTSKQSEKISKESDIILQESDKKSEKMSKESDQASTAEILFKSQPETETDILLTKASPERAEPRGILLTSTTGPDEPGIQHLQVNTVAGLCEE